MTTLTATTCRLCNEPMPGPYRGHATNFPDDPYEHDAEAVSRLACDMTSECRAAVTHIDEKGWVYCAPHGEQRKESKRCRRMTSAEIAALESGQTIWYDPERNLPGAS